MNINKILYPILLLLVVLSSCDYEKIKAALGIDRMPVRAADGIMKTIRSFSD